MTQNTTSSYETYRQIAGLEAELKAAGFSNVQVFPSATVQARSSGDDIINAIAKAGVPRYQAAAYSDVVKKGGAVVVVETHFGQGAKATQILNKYKPIQSASASASASSNEPFKGLSGTPLILQQKGEYESYSGTPLLLEQKGEYVSYSGTPLIIEQKGEYQSFSGTPLLLKQNGSYQSFSGTPLLLEEKGEYKSYSGTPLLLNNPAPFSSWLGLPVLSR
jgi:hypothetical protein